MKIDIGKFRLREGDNVNLKKWPTHVKPFYKSKNDYEDILASHREKLAEQQSRFYAHHRYALLLIFQSMDAGGKDGAIKHVMSGVNPQGCQVFSFKHPSAQELEHDFLWRSTRCLPERGHIGIFNRSYYEEVLIVRVHPEILRGEGLPDELLNEKKFWQHRYTSILNLEKHLYRNGTRTVKFFLHLSREEQRKRLLARIEDPEKNWKISLDDIKERGRWKEYQRAYEHCLAATSAKIAPWHIVPADDKPNARLIISQAVVDALCDLRTDYPKLNKAQRKQLQAIRKSLEK